MGLLIATGGSFTGGTCNNGSMFCESLARLVTGSTRHAGQLVYPAYSSPTMRAYDLPTSVLLMFLRLICVLCLCMEYLKMKLHRLTLISGKSKAAAEIDDIIALGHVMLVLATRAFTDAPHNELVST